MRTAQFFGNCTAAVAILMGLGIGVAPVAATEVFTIAQLSPAEVGAGVDASRVVSPTRDFFDRGRSNFAEEIRRINQGGSVSAFSNDLLTIDESLEHEAWLYPLEERETQLEIRQIQILPPTE